MKRYVADFETNNSEEECRVWAAACEEIGGNETFLCNNLDDFMGHIFENPGAYYFHNLKFDGEFIIYWLFKNGWEYTENKELKDKQFKALISDKGQFYSITVKLKNEVKILDSLKILPISVDEIAEAFDLPIRKLKINYEEIRAINHIITPEEKEYIFNDVRILNLALQIMFKQGLNKMTQASNALNDYKKMIGKSFEYLFPEPDYDEFCRESYRGGFTYLNPKYRGKDVKKGLILDVNSLYPWVMRYCKLPYGKPIFYKGKYKLDKEYDLYIQQIKCSFKIKHRRIPTIQIKHSYWQENEYLESSNGEEVTLTLTSVDLKLFLEHYDVFNLTYISGYKFKSSFKLFRAYVDKWYKVKEEATLTKNAPMRFIAKRMQNALYGKFGVNPKTGHKIPFYDKESDIVRYRISEPETRKPLYIPVASFITAWARDKTIRAAQSQYDRFIYADTDSLHLIKSYLPTNLEVDKVKLGAWKLEGYFTKGRYIRQKTYAEKIKGKIHVTCAGLPHNLHFKVNWNNFVAGSIIEGKLMPTHVPGGIMLKETTFKIKI